MNETVYALKTPHVIFLSFLFGRSIHTWQNWGKLQVKLEFSIQDCGKLQVTLEFCHVHDVGRQGFQKSMEHPNEHFLTHDLYLDL